MWFKVTAHPLPKSFVNVKYEPNRAKERNYLLQTKIFLKWSSKTLTQKLGSRNCTLFVQRYYLGYASQIGQKGEKM